MECVKNIRAPARCKVQRAPVPEKITPGAVPRKIRVRARRPCKVPWIWVLASPIFNQKNHQSKVLTLVKPGIPGSLIGPVQFLFKAGPYLDLAGPNLAIAEIHDQIWQ